MQTIMNSRFLKEMARDLKMPIFLGDGCGGTTSFWDFAQRICIGMQNTAKITARIK